MKTAYYYKSVEDEINVSYASQLLEKILKYKIPPRVLNKIENSWKKKFMTDWITA
jgi:hypothetical protein